VDHWRHPFESEPAKGERQAEAGERFVDRDFFDDGEGGGPYGPLPVQGSRVIHAQFGEGEVQRVLEASELAFVVFFPALGAKKVLARFLRRA
jgi:hypothetical protein